MDKDIKSLPVDEAANPIVSTDLSVNSNHQQQQREQDDDAPTQQHQ
jgi:hypothetical protein